jgi:N-methylhydantoinase B
MVGAARVGEREILAMAEEFGWDTLYAFTLEWLNYSERLMIAAIKKMPSGQVAVSNIHDPLPGTPSEGVKITAGVKIDSEKAVIGVDLRDNPDTMRCGLNLSEACARTAAMIGVFNSIEDPVPTNAGSFRRIKVHIREGSVAGGGKHPTSMSVATTNLADRITNAVQRGFSLIEDGLGLAECGLTSSASESVISGHDPRTDGKPYVNEVFLVFTAGAAAAKTDAWVTTCHAGNGGMCCIDSVELDELHFPILVKERWLVPDTEGSGRTIGAPSAYCEFGPLGDNPLDAAWVTDGGINMAKGTRGGHDGAPVKNYRKTTDSKLERLPPCATIRIQPGEAIVAYTGGGGGYGPPYERAPEDVKEDVVEGYITRQRAYEVYGVVFTEDMEIDEAATVARRRALTQG